MSSNEKGKDLRRNEDVSEIQSIYKNISIDRMQTQDRQTHTHTLVLTAREKRTWRREERKKKKRRERAGQAQTGVNRLLSVSADEKATPSFSIGRRAGNHFHVKVVEEIKKEEEKNVLLSRNGGGRGPWRESLSGLSGRRSSIERK